MAWQPNIIKTNHSTYLSKPLTSRTDWLLLPNGFCFNSEKMICRTSKHEITSSHKHNHLHMFHIYCEGSSPFMLLLCVKFVSHANHYLFLLGSSNTWTVVTTPVLGPTCSSLHCRLPNWPRNGRRPWRSRGERRSLVLGKSGNERRSESARERRTEMLWVQHSF